MSSPRRRCTCLVSERTLEMFTFYSPSAGTCEAGHGVGVHAQVLVPQSLRAADARFGSDRDVRVEPRSTVERRLRASRWSPVQGPLSPRMERWVRRSCGPLASQRARRAPWSEALLRERCVRADRARQSSWAASTRFTTVTSTGPDQQPKWLQRRPRRRGTHAPLVPRLRRSSHQPRHPSSSVSWAHLAPR